MKTILVVAFVVAVLGAILIDFIPNGMMVNGYSLTKTMMILPAALLVVMVAAVINALRK